MKLNALSITRWKHEDASIKDPVHLYYGVDLSQLSFFQVGLFVYPPQASHRRPPLLPACFICCIIIIIIIATATFCSRKARGRGQISCHFGEYAGLECRELPSEP